jgi:toxin ParE1/3/4
MGKKRDNLKNGLRSFPLGRYLIFYYPIPDGIKIIRVLFGGRNLVALDWEAEDEAIDEV